MISINMDKPCVRCGKGGATQGGYCLKCIEKSLVEGKYDKILKPIQKKIAGDYLKEMEGKEMPKIGDKTIAFIHDTIFHMLNEQKGNLEKAYIQAAGDKLTIAISATISPAKRDSETTVKVAMSFVKEKVKDELEVTIDEAQQELFQK